jgi:site-specific DNA recombinase
MRKEQRLKNPTRKTAVIYARVSSKEQEKEGFSIPAQLKLLTNYAAGQGFTVVQKYVDVETAKQTGRSGFAEMVNHFKKQYKPTTQKESHPVLLVEKTDRLYRNLKDWVILDELNLEIHFVKENFVLSPESRSSEKFIHGIKVLMAKNYIDNLSEETKKGMLEKADQGIYPSFAPIGYINVDNNGKRHIQPDPIISPLIRILYEWYATGNYSLLEVTKKAQAEGLTYRKTGAKLHKSIVHKILTNPIYYGDFDWAGRRYRGNHHPIVSKGLFDRVQEVLSEKGRRRTRQQKHRWAFQGLVSCGHCGCAMTGEIKKGRYVYYHCTGHKGKCPERYVREEELDLEFTEALKAIKIDKEVLDWVVTALKESHSEEKRYHNDTISTLQNQYKKLQDRIDVMYIDKLDGKVSENFFIRKSEEWGTEQANILRQIEQHQGANRFYLEEGTRLLELAQKAVTLYKKQEMEEKRRLLNFVFSNSTWKDGKLTPVYRKPFDLLALTNTAYQKEKAVSSKKDSLFENWLPGQDSNLQPSG